METFLWFPILVCVVTMRRLHAAAAIVGTSVVDDSCSPLCSFQALNLLSSLLGLRLQQLQQMIESFVPVPMLDLVAPVPQMAKKVVVS